MTNSQHKSSVHDYLLNQTFKLTPVNLENLLNICNSHELNKEFEPLVDTLWNIGLDLVNKRFEVYKNDEDFSELSMIQNPEDWKKIVQVVRDSRMRRRRRIKEA
jgi:hypothetical protein